MIRKGLILFTVLSVVLQTVPVVPLVSAASEDSSKVFLIGLKESVDADQFIKQKDLKYKKAKKAKKAHKIKTSNLVVASLSEEEVANIEQDESVRFVEEDANVQVAQEGSVEETHEYVTKMAQDSETMPWGIHDIGSEYTLTQSMKGQNIKVAVLDTGIAEHPDLKVTAGVSFVATSAGYIDDHGHGTHVAGTIAALHNEAGIVGAAPETELYAVKVLDQHGSGTYSQVIQGIDWAIANQIDILSMSFGGEADSTALHEAIKKANEQGVLLIAAAGNKGSGEETEAYPALYPEVMSVGAVTSTYQRASFSSTGSEIDIVAPGVEILSTTVDGQYGVLSGTSMAAPHVTGAAAVLWSANKEWSQAEVKQALLDTATPLGDAREYGRGFVNVAKAVGLVDKPVITPPVVTPPSPEPTTFSINQIDVQLLGLSNTLEYLKEIALKQGNMLVAQELKEQEAELRETSINLHQLPTELSKIVKSEAEQQLLQSEINDYFQSKQGEFETLQLGYKKLIDTYSNQLVLPETVEGADVTPTADTMEPNNTSSAAYPITLGNSYVSYLSTANDLDYYTFTPGTSGAVTLQLYNPAGKDYDVVITDAAKNIVGSGTRTGEGNEEFKFPVAAGKQYYVKVYGFSGYSATSFYTLVLSAPMSVLNYGVIDVDLSKNSQQVYSFTPDTSGPHRIFTGPYAGIGTSNDTVLEIYSDSTLNRLLVSNDDHNGTQFSEIVPTLTAGTTYYVKLRHYSSSGAVHARLTVMPLLSVLPFDMPVDLNLIAGTDKVFSYTSSVTGVYKFYTGPYGGGNVENDTVLQLYSDYSLTNVIAQNDDANGTVFSEVTATLQEGRTYYLKVRPFNPTSGAVYTRVRMTGPTQPVPTPALTLGSTVITEANVNDGSFVATQVVTLRNGTFALDMSTGVTVNNLPSGLTAVVTRNNDTQLTIRFTGKALVHEDSNDISSASITIAKAKINTATTDVVSGTFVFDFKDVPMIPVLTPPDYFVDFDGTDDTMTAYNVPINMKDGGKNTVEFWMYWDGKDGTMPFGWNNAYDLFINRNSFGFNTAEGNVIGISSAGLSNKWVHVAATFVNGVPSPNTVELYINGEKQALTNYGPVTTIPRKATSTAIISGFGVSNGYKFDGKLSDVRIWDRALSAAEVGRTLTGTEEGLVGYWKLDSIATGKAYDRSPNQKHLISSNFQAPVLQPQVVSKSANTVELSWNTVPGATSYLVKRNGNVVYDAAAPIFTETILHSRSVLYQVFAKNERGESLGASALFEKSATTQYSLEFDGVNDVMKATNVPVNIKDGGKNTVDFWMYWDGTSGKMPFSWNTPYDLYLAGGVFGFNTGEDNIIGIPSTDLANRWVHVAAVFVNDVPSPTNLELYIDGVKQTLGTYYTVSTGVDATISPVRRATTTVIVSGYVVKDKYNFDGKLSDVRIWNRALTQVEVQASMNGMVTGSEAGLVANWKLDAIATGKAYDFSIYKKHLIASNFDSPPLYLQAVKQTEKNAELSWNPIPGATYYTLKRNSYVIYEGPNRDFTDTFLFSRSMVYEVSARNARGEGVVTRITYQPHETEPPFLAFDGVDDVIKASNVPVNTQDGGKNTVEFWMYWDGTNNGMPFGWNGAYDLYFAGGAFGFNTGTDNIMGIPSEGLENRWAHVAAVFTNGVPSPDTLELYVDGVKQNLIVFEKVSSMVSPTASTTRRATSTVIFSGYGISDKYKFDGKLSDMRVWNRALTQTEIQANKESTLTGNESGLVGYWYVDSLSTGTAYDRTANQNHGIASHFAAPMLQPQAIQTAMGTVQLNWQPVAGVTTYVVKRNGTIVYEGANPSFVDTGLSLQGYTYEISAKSERGESTTAPVWVELTI